VNNDDHPQHEHEQQQQPTSVELLLDDEPNTFTSPNTAMASRSNNERNNGVIIQYDHQVGGHHDGVTRFDLEDDNNSMQSSIMVDLDLNMLPLDATTLPEEAIRTRYHPRRAGPRHRAAYNTDTIRSNHSAKSVTIANQVTEFHYSGENSFKFL
jgi:hypothetical protein